MLQGRFVQLADQRIEADDLPVHMGRESLMAGDELGEDRKNIAPAFKPVFGIAPMPLGRECDFSQRCSIFWFSSQDLHVWQDLDHENNRNITLRHPDRVFDESTSGALSAAFW